MSISTVRADGVLLVNGEPFYPFGFFHIADYGRTVDGLMTDLEMIGAAGFNTILVTAWEGLTYSQWHAFYDRADALGVKVLAHASPSSKPEKFVATFKSKPAHIGWYIWDDVQSTTDFVALKKTYEQYKAWDTDHITNYAVLMSRMTGVDPGKLAETFGEEQYPIGDNDSIIDVQTGVRLAVAFAAKYQQSPWAYLQTFAWDGERPPTSLEYKQMATLAITAGAKGIINYTFFDSLNYLPDYTELWEGLKTLPPVIAAMFVKPPNAAPHFAIKPQAKFVDAKISLSALGTDDAGEEGLSYSWGTVGPVPSAPKFSLNKSNAAKNTTVTVTAPGVYKFRVTVSDASGLRTSADVSATA